MTLIRPPSASDKEMSASDKEMSACAKLQSSFSPIRIVGGCEKTFTIVTYVVDTNVLVYRHDPRFPEKQAKATRLLRDGLANGEARIPAPTARSV
jgi:hypothetical protein